MASEQGPLDLEILAASLRAGSSDIGPFIESLATKLEAALPGRVRILRGRQGLVGAKLVKAIVVDLGGTRLEVTRAGGDSVHASRGLVSGGIVLRSESVQVDAWIEMLSEALAAEAQRNEQTRQALERLLLS
jgi:hypothetical protein